MKEKLCEFCIFFLERCFVYAVLQIVVSKNVYNIFTSQLPPWCSKEMPHPYQKYFLKKSLQNSTLMRVTFANFAR